MFSGSYLSTPIGDSSVKDKPFSIYFTFEDWGSHPMNKAVFAEYNLKVLNQVKGQHVERKGDDNFSSRSKIYKCLYNDIYFSLCGHNKFNKKKSTFWIIIFYILSNAFVWLGLAKFMALSDLRDATKGLIVKDTLVVEVVLHVISVADVSSSKKLNIK